MGDAFQIGPVVRTPGERVDGQLFVGEMEPHNAERPWLVIRGGVRGAFVVVEAEIEVLADLG